MGLACALLALLPAAAVAPAAARADEAGFASAMLRELNRVRAVYRLPPVRDDARMDGGARAYSRSMAARGYVAHGQWTGRVAAAARRAQSIGEVLGWLTPDDPRGEAAWLVHSWLKSPYHRPVVLGASFRRVGIGRATGRVGTAFSAVYTVDFATAR